MAICHKWNLILAYMCMLGATTSFLMTPKFIGKAIDKITTSSSDGIPTNIIIEVGGGKVLCLVFSWANLSTNTSTSHW